MHSNESSYLTSYKLKNQLPTNVSYYLSRFIGSKALAKKATELRKEVYDLVRLCNQLKFFTMNEWVFDSASQNKLNGFLATFKNPAEIAEFDVNLSQLNWKSYSMNMGYGIKYYILREEASMPSMGYNDVV